MRLLIGIYLLTHLLACEQTTRNVLSNKRLIDPDSVNAIYLKFKSDDTDSIPVNENQWKAFASSWNEAKSVGLMKYMPEYWIYVKMKNGTDRVFRSSGNNIKEKDDWAFEISYPELLKTMAKGQNIFPTPGDYTPIEFIEAVSKKMKTGDNSYYLGVAMIGKFPSDWVTIEHVEKLIQMIDSKDTCSCYINPLLSFIPNDYAEKGGYAASFIKAYKNNEPL